MIDWKFLNKLLKLQNESGVRAANKLTHRHLNFNAQKMKVKLCTQTLSSSVAVALEVCRKIGLPDFIGSEETSSFIRLTDRLFDAMNSRPLGQGYKSPLRPSNKNIWSLLFDQATKLLMELHCEDKQGEFVPLYMTKKGTCIKGLVIAISSLRMMMEEVVDDETSDLQ